MEKEIKKVYKKLLSLYVKLNNNDYDRDLEEELLSLYREYIKLKVACSGKGLKNSKIGNYLYALDLAVPMLFRKIYKDLILDDFSIDVGVLAGMGPVVDEVLTKDRVLERLLNDLEVLKIDSYDILPTDLPSHDGKKVAIYNEVCGRDALFIRQNKNGKWSYKIRYENGVYVLDDVPRSGVITLHGDDYEYIKTLELVKLKK